MLVFIKAWYSPARNISNIGVSSYLFISQMMHASHYIMFVTALIYDND